MNHYRFEHSDMMPNKNLILFEVPPTNFGVDRIHWTEYRTSAPLTEEGPVEFAISGSGKQYIDLHNTRLYIKAKIVKPNGDPLPKPFKVAGAGATADNFNPEHNVGPVNLWLHSLFSQVDLLMQQNVVNACTVYPYKSFMETLIYPYEPRLGEAELFYKDDFSNMDSTEVWANKGLKRRALKVLYNTEYDMEGPLHLDLCQQERYILDGVDIGLRLWQSKNSFRLMSAVGECRVLITEAVLKVCKVDVADGVRENHMKILKQQKALYPYQRTEMKFFNVKEGSNECMLDDIFQGEVPNKLVFGLVTAQSFNGHIDKNPYNFKHCKISEVGVKVDDMPVPVKAYTPNFGTSHVNSAAVFRAIFEDNPHLDISHDEFDHGYTLFSFSLRQDNPDTMNTIQKGNCSILIKFSDGLPENMMLVMMGKFPHILEINEGKEVTP